MPGGSAGGGKRSLPPEASPRSGGNGGPSLFTPAYRVSHSSGSPRPAANTRPGPAGPGAPGPGADDAGNDADEGKPGVGYGWEEAGPDDPEVYQPSGYSDGSDETLWPGASGSGSGYSWTDEYQGSESWPSPTSSGRSQYAQSAVSRAVRGFPPTPGDPMPVYPPGPFAAWNRGTAGRGPSPRAHNARDDSPAVAAATITPDEFDTNHSLPAIKDPILGRAVTSSAPGRTEPGARTGTALRGGGGRQTQPGPAIGQGRGRSSHAGGRAAGGQGRGRRATGGPRARGRGRKHQSAFLAIGAAVVIIAVGALILVLTSSGSSTPPVRPKAQSTPTPVQTSPTRPGGKWEYIGARTTDSTPLTSRELYPGSFASGGTVYTKVTQRQGTTCRDSIIGSALKAAVRQAGCTQAIRATYVSRSAGVMATIGVFNLDSATAAGQAATKAGHSSFVAQLQASTGPAKFIGRGTGIEEALVKGHYLILVWAEATNLHTPRNKADRARLEAFMNLLIARTANVSLSYRMVYGQPVPQPTPSHT